MREGVYKAITNKNDKIDITTIDIISI